MTNRNRADRLVDLTQKLFSFQSELHWPFDTRMKKLFLFLWLPLSLLACQKNDAPLPDAGTVIAGEYTLVRTASYYNGQPGYDITLPQVAGGNVRTGVVSVVRNTEALVTISVTQKVNGTAGTPTAFGKMAVKAVNGVYELYLKNKKNGTADGTYLSFEVSDTTQTASGIPEINRYTVEAKR